MKHILKFLAGTIMVLAVGAAAISFSSFVEHEGNAATAVQKAAKANPYEIIGTQITTSFELRQAEADETVARAAADHDAVAIGLAVICFLLSAGTWLLAEISSSLSGSSPKPASVSP